MALSKKKNCEHTHELINMNHTKLLSITADWIEFVARVEFWAKDLRIGIKVWCYWEQLGEDMETWNTIGNYCEDIGK
jgi:hypothetical protein